MKDIKKYLINEAGNDPLKIHLVDPNEDGELLEVKKIENPEYVCVLLEDAYLGTQGDVIYIQNEDALQEWSKRVNVRMDEAEDGENEEDWDIDELGECVDLTDELLELKQGDIMYINSPVATIMRF